MAFDIDQTLKQMGTAMASVLAGEWPKVQACVTQALQAERDVLSAIAEARLAGEIDDDELKSQLEDEKGALQAALLVCKISAEVMAQQAVNAAMRVPADAIDVALKAL
jgi:hypothetical protein